jgi:hypothetical protein
MELNIAAGSALDAGQLWDRYRRNIILNPVAQYANVIAIGALEIEPAENLLPGGVALQNAGLVSAAG